MKKSPAPEIFLAPPISKSYLPPRNDIEHFFILVLVLICFFGLCYGAGAPGAPWTPEETEIIYRKIMHLYNDFKKNGIKAEMRKRGYDDKEYTPNTNFPSAAKVMF